MSGSSGRRSDDHALPLSEWAWAAATTSGRAACTCEWIANAAAFTGQVPSTTSPWSLTRMRSLHADLLEAHPERVDPEVVEPLRVAGGDVTGHPFVEPELPEQSEGGGEALLAVQALVLDRLEGGELGRKAI